ncbi:hypothetical protein [Litoribacillus peritrichatus]
MKSFYGIYDFSYGHKEEFKRIIHVQSLLYQAMEMDGLNLQQASPL